MDRDTTYNHGSGRLVTAAKVITANVVVLPTGFDMVNDIVAINGALARD